MTNPESLMLKKALYSSINYLEYGSGTSTITAAGFPHLHTLSVDSSAIFVAKHLMSNIDIVKAEQSARLRFLVVDIGQTRDWGYPNDDSKSHLWPNYALAPYATSFIPDTILIDGRFRIACACLAFLEAPNATILIHDYKFRNNYHILEEFIVIKEQADSMISCRRSAHMDVHKVKNLLRPSLYSPDN